MTEQEFDIGVIGGGSAGLTVAAGAAQLGAKTLLIEKEPVLGGDCLHYGCVPSKTLIKTANTYHLMKHAKRYGLPEMELKPIDFRDVAKRIQSVIQIIQKHDSEERFCSLGAKVVFGTVSFTDEHTVQVNGRSCSAKTWVIATGSSPAVPPIKGIENTPYITNRDIFSLEKLPQSMMMIGGGPIACEMAQAFCRLGTRVSVIEVADQILIKEDPDMAQEVMNRMQAEGVTFYLRARINNIQDMGNEREVIFTTPEHPEPIHLRAETLLVAAGRTANVKGLGLENIEIEFDRRGIKVDERLRTTTHKHIYGAGDVNGAYQFTHTAGYEGGIVIRNAIFHLPAKANYSLMPWCTYTDPELASIGMNEKAAKEAGIEYSLWTEPFIRNDRSLTEGEENGMIKMLLDRHDKPIGIQILGPHAGELVSEWVAVMNGKVKLSTIASAVHPYPTLGEINKRVIGNMFARKLYSEKVKKGLKFFFNLRGRACGL
jgi:pyruvate/2-oxoglutarate dehydrogenase complex dihydrolipoamide dehydrogenase (E3) component